MIINNEKHIALLKKELLCRILDWEKTLNQYAAKLWKSKSLLLCYYAGFDEARGNILLKFKNAINLPPRKNEYFTCFLSEYQNEKVENWGGLKYKDLREKRLVQFEAKIQFIKYDEGISLVGVSGVNEEQVKDFKKDKLIFLGPTDPPLLYLQDLIEHLESINPANDSILSLNTHNDNWNPLPLKADEDIVAKLQTDLVEHNLSIIQGPPGTGKTYRVASFIKTVVQNGYSVMVTAMTNRALIEVLEKEQMNTLLASGSVFKTNISAAESRNKKLTGLNPLKSIGTDKPQALFTTYYTMSNIALNTLKAKHFDYVIIEEASQAYLSTISLARKVGKKCIVVGDKEQLPPIFHKTYFEKEPNNYYWMVNGLSAISNKLSNKAQYILKDSFRLSPSAVNNTNAFYNNILTSKSSISFPISINENYFNKNGGIKLKVIDYKARTDLNSSLKTTLIQSINAIHKYDQNASIAILAFNRDTIRILTNFIFQRFKNEEFSILVDTIDRIQGLTVDFTIFTIPFEAFGGALDLKRFNVATSRAKKGTLIIADNNILQFVKTDKKLINYFNSIKS